MSRIKRGPIAMAAALGVIIVALAGCAPPPLERLHAYDGPERSLNQVATVFGGRYERNFNNSGKTLELSPYVNGRPTFDFATVLYLQPGTHSLRVVYRAGGVNSSSSAGGTLTAKFEAGRAYEVKFEIEKKDEKNRGLLASLSGQPPKRTIKFWLEDRGRGFVVTDEVLVHEQ